MLHCHALQCYTSVSTVAQYSPLPTLCPSKDSLPFPEATKLFPVWTANHPENLYTFKQKGSATSYLADF
jgi:hypothetical protein